jgi:hypothetical protein
VFGSEPPFVPILLPTRKSAARWRWPSLAVKLLLAVFLGALASAWADQEAAGDSGAAPESTEPSAQQASDAPPIEPEPQPPSDTENTADSADQIDALVHTGTQAPAPTAESNLMARAVLLDNIKAVAWLRDHMSRYYDEPESPASGQDKIRHDAWSEAAALALQNPVESERARLFNMLVDANTDWAGSVDRAVYRHYQINWARVPAGHADGESLLAYTVATGDVVLLRHAIELGALRGGASTESAGDALATALRLRRLDLLQALVDAGASPMAPTSRDWTPLALAIDTSRTKPEHQPESSDQARDFRHASVEILLRALTPDQVRAANTPASTLITTAFDAHDPSVISQLVKAGFTLGQVPLNRLAAKLVDGDADLQAILTANTDSAAPENQAIGNRNGALAQALRDMIDQGDNATLDHLFVLRRNDFVFNANDRWHLARLMDAVWTDAIDALIKRGATIDDRMQQKVVDSMLPGAIGHMLKSTGSAIENFCITPEKSDPPLVNALTYLNDAQWQQWLDLGLARLRVCDAADAPPLNMVATALLSNPFSLVGQRKTYIPQRIIQLRQAGMKAANFAALGLPAPQVEFGNDPAMQALVSALGTPLEHDQAAGSGQPDAASRVWFKITGQSQYADGSEVGQPLTVKIEGIDPMASSLRAQIQADDSEVHPLVFEDKPEAVAELEGQPRLIALWAPEMKTSLAFELPVPDLPRLKSITIALVPPPDRPASTPVSTVAQINAANELRLGGGALKKPPAP